MCNMGVMCRSGLKFQLLHMVSLFWSRDSVWSLDKSEPQTVYQCKTILEIVCGIFCKILISAVIKARKFYMVCAYICYMIFYMIWGYYFDTTLGNKGEVIYNFISQGCQKYLEILTFSNPIHWSAPTPPPSPITHTSLHYCWYWNSQLLTI